MSMAEGKRRLIEAALKLSVEKRSLAAVGIRELTREAGLSPNAFYRHFDSVDEVGLAIVEQISALVRSGLKEVRQADVSATELIRNSMSRVFQFALENELEFVFMYRERYGLTEQTRGAVEEYLSTIEDELARDIDRLRLAPMLSERQIKSLMREIVPHMFALSLDYIEQSAQRKPIVRRAERFILMLFLGSITLADEALTFQVYPAYRLLARSAA